jgi:hypothetical protein
LHRRPSAAPSRPRLGNAGGSARLSL